jgi:hypothetical protein
MPQITQLQPPIAKNRTAQGNLLEHPGPLHEGVEPVVGKPRLKPECRRMGQNEPAMELPPCIAPEPRPVAGIVMARSLPLRPVAEVMDANHADRPRHSDQCAEINAKVFEPERALETRMNQAPMHPDGMSETERDHARGDEQQKCRP